jgi:hypothetical protein
MYSLYLRALDGVEHKSKALQRFPAKYGAYVNHLSALVKHVTSTKGDG